MKRRVIALCGLVPSLIAGDKALAATPGTVENPYSGIMEKNVFGLKPPPPPVETVQTSAPPAKITLLGIANMFGTKKAILKAAEPGKPAAPGAAPQDTAVVLAEGEAQQGIEVNEIDERAGSVKVNNHGIAYTLTFEKDGVKLPAGPAPSAPVVPGIPGAPGLPVPMPMMQPAAGKPGFPTPGFGAIPGARSVNPAAGLTSSTGDSSTAAAAGFPPRQVRTSDTPLTYEQAMVMVEANREANKSLVANGLMPPLPPTPFTPKESQPQTTPAQPATQSPALPPPGFPVPLPPQLPTSH